MKEEKIKIIWDLLGKFYQEPRKENIFKNDYFSYYKINDLKRIKKYSANDIYNATNLNSSDEKMEIVRCEVRVKLINEKFQIEAYCNIKNLESGTVNVNKITEQNRDILDYLLIVMCEELINIKQQEVKYFKEVLHL